MVALLAAAAAAVLLRHYWPLFEQNFSMVYLLQEGGFYSLMAFSFGQSLLRRPRAAVHAARGQGAWAADAARGALHAPRHRRVGRCSSS